jgi:hypothetical protein
MKLRKAEANFSDFYKSKSWCYRILHVEAVSSEDLDSIGRSFVGNIAGITLGDRGVQGVSDSLE